VIVDPGEQPVQPALNPGEVRIVGGIDGYINATQNPNVTIRFRRVTEGTVRVKAYDLRGRTVWNGNPREGPAGSEDEVVWSTDEVAGGVYVVRVQGAGLDKRLKVAIRR